MQNKVFCAGWKKVTFYFSVDISLDGTTGSLQ
jgi:hypothetical protein